MDISIIIKAYNEENNIAKAIQSSLKSLKKYNGEVIVVDSLSSDDTVKIAKKYPIKIVQLNKNSIKTPAAALEVGYRASKGQYLLVIDGDMVLNQEFIKRALPKFKDKNIGAVGGLIYWPDVGNIISKRFHKKYKKIKIGQVEYLDGGGLYNKKAIKQVGYLSNPYLFSGEESELGYELIKRNYKIIRLNIPFATHYFDKDSTPRILLRKWKTRYMFGFGQVLRLSISSGFFIKYLLKLRIYILTLIWYILLLIVILSLKFSFIPFLIYSIITLILAITLLIKKRSLKEGFFSIFSWAITTTGIVCGFFKPSKTAKDYNLKFKLIKNV